MDVEFADSNLERMYADKAFSGGHSDAVVKGFRKVMSWVHGATDERDFCTRSDRYTLRNSRVSGGTNGR
jgi:hypothetical protein